MNLSQVFKSKSFLETKIYIGIYVLISFFESATISNGNTVTKYQS